jgi:putative membrane protein
MSSRLKLGLLLSANALALSALQCQSSPSNTKPSTSGSSSAAASAKATTPAAQPLSATATPSADSRGLPPSTGAATASTAKSDPVGTKSANTTATSKLLDDAQIAAITDETNNAEIEQGKLAQSKAKDARVRAFAKMMVEKHTEERRDQEKLHIAKTDSPDSERATRAATTALRSLREKTGADFDKAYVELQVDEHKKVLATLDKELLPAAHDKQLEAYLEKMKPDVESHLTRAEQLERDLGTASSGSAKRGSVANQPKTASRSASSPSSTR